MTTPALPAEGAAHVPRACFESSVRVARRMGTIVPLSEIVDRHLQGRSTAGLIAITFDDAYAAVSTELRDVIVRQAIPVTVFVVTEAAETGSRYWWDRVEDLFPRVPAERWRGFEAACGLPDEYRRGQPAEHGPLRPLRQWLLASCAGRWPAWLEPALHDLETETGYRTPHRSMTFQEVAEFASLPGVELGVHTVSHPVLPLLSNHDMALEITTAYRRLKDRFASVLPVLAVPFGLYDERTLRVARSSGMAAWFTLAGRLRRSPGGRAMARYCVTRGETSFRLGLRLLGVSDLVKCGSWSAPAYPELPSAVT